MCIASTHARDVQDLSSLGDRPGLAGTPTRGRDPVDSKLAAVLWIEHDASDQPLHGHASVAVAHFVQQFSGHDPTVGGRRKQRASWAIPIESVAENACYVLAVWKPPELSPNLLIDAVNTAVGSET